MKKKKQKGETHNTRTQHKNRNIVLVLRSRRQDFYIKAQRNDGSDQRKCTDQCYANGNHSNNMWMHGQLRVYCNFEFVLGPDRKLQSIYRRWSLKCWTVKVWLVTDQNRSWHLYSYVQWKPLVYNVSWECAELISKVYSWHLTRVSAIFQKPRLLLRASHCVRSSSLKQLFVFLCSRTQGAEKQR